MNNSHGRHEKMNRKLANNSGGSSPKPSLMMTKFVPQTTVTASASKGEGRGGAAELGDYSNPCVSARIVQPVDADLHVTTTIFRMETPDERDAVCQDAADCRLGESIAPQTSVRPGLSGVPLSDGREALQRACYWRAPADARRDTTSGATIFLARCC